MRQKLMNTGIVSTVIVAVCCFTPALAILLGAVGLSAWLGWLDYVLLPLLAGCMGLVIYAATTQPRRTCR